MFTRHTRSMVFAAVAFGVAGTLCAASATVSTASLRALPERAAASIAVDRAAAPAIMARVRGASAHYMPMCGSAVPRIETGARGYTNTSQDLTYYGGPTVRSESAYDLYVNCSSFNGCWGAPGTFLGNLSSTSFCSTSTPAARRITGTPTRAVLRRATTRPKRCRTKTSITSFTPRLLGTVPDTDISTTSSCRQVSNSAARPREAAMRSNIARITVPSTSATSGTRYIPSSRIRASTAACLLTASSPTRPIPPYRTKCSRRSPIRTFKRTSLGIIIISEKSVTSAATAPDIPPSEERRWIFSASIQTVTTAVRSHPRATRLRGSARARRRPERCSS